MKDSNYYNSLDKRTKEYKDWKKRKDDEINSIKGVGDVIEDITKATGIKKVVKFIAGDDCGCDERKEKLNNLPLRKKPRCATEEEYYYLKSIQNATAMSNEQANKFFNTYNSIFNTKKKTTRCSSCIRSMIKHVKLYLNTYE